jgi:regulator of sirC expression with transglutaminase-like and TPR domain
VFADLGFEGNGEDYYDPCNSCLNDVLERRTGLPITLSIVYKTIAERCGRPTQGVGFPGHFIVRDCKTDVLLDPFRLGRPLDKDELLELLRQQGVESPKWDEDLVAAVGKRQILERMLNNFRNAYVRRLDPERIEVVDALARTLEEVRDEGPGSMVQ